jgi:hypothetical protein
VPDREADEVQARQQLDDVHTATVPPAGRVCPAR